MNKHTSFIIASTLFISSVIMAFGQEQVPAPSIVEGDFWQFKVNDKAGNGKSVSGIIANGTYIMRASKLGLQVFQLVDNQEIIFERPGMLYFLMARGQNPDTRAAPSATSRDLKFPLFVGKQWQYEFDLNIAQGTRHGMVDIRVVGRENIKISAGSFEVFKIEKSVYWPTSNPRVGSFMNDVTATYFYSSEAKCMVKYSSVGSDGAKRDIELIKFGSSKTESKN